jgi:hypothetical protein
MGSDVDRRPESGPGLQADTGPFCRFVRAKKLYAQNNISLSGNPQGANKHRLEAADTIA